MADPIGSFWFNPIGFMFHRLYVIALVCYGCCAIL